MTIIKKFDTSEVIEQKDNPFTISKKFIITTAISLFILIVIEVWASNMVVTYGDRLERVSILTRSLQMENQILENEIARHSSLANIASQSALLGFSKPAKVQYIR